MRPPPELATRIVPLAWQLCDDLRLKGCPFAADRLHVTLFTLPLRAGVPEPLVNGLRRTAARLEASSFEVSFNTVESFLHKWTNNPVVLSGEPKDLSDLAAFRRRLMNGLFAAGLADPRFPHGFTPHVTLLYDDEVVPPTQIEPIRWVVRDFVLVHSHVGRTCHDELGRWTLCG